MKGGSTDQTYNVNGGFKPTTKRLVDASGADFYPTPAWATFALVDNEPFDGDIWECACGDGAMARVMESYGLSVTSSDLYNHGYGEADHDFLATNRQAPNIITNPPYYNAEHFVAKGLKQAEKKLALLLRLAFLEGANRSRRIFHVNPPSRVWVFSERITFYPKGVTPKGSGTTAYAWFIWDSSHTGPTELRWFTPGYKRAAYPALSNKSRPASVIA